MSKEPRVRRPWSIEELPEAFQIVSANGISVAVVYFEDEEVRRGIIKRMSRADAAYIAQQIVRLPELLDAAKTAGASASEAAGDPTTPE